jgi:hypothetical protein
LFALALAHRCARHKGSFSNPLLDCACNRDCGSIRALRELIVIRRVIISLRGRIACDDTDNDTIGSDDKVPPVNYDFTTVRRLLSFVRAILVPHLRLFVNSESIYRDYGTRAHTTPIINHSAGQSYLRNDVSRLSERGIVNPLTAESIM